jgi:hypothetical protein
MRSTYLIGASGLSEHRVRLTRRLGYGVILTDKGHTPLWEELSQAVDKPYLETVLLDGADVEGHRRQARLARERGHDVELVYCPAEFGAESAAAVREVFGLPDNPREARYLARDKGRALARLADMGVTTPGMVPQGCKGASRWVVKPSLGSGGSRGVRVLDQHPSQGDPVVMEEILHPGDQWIVEPFIEGRHIDLNGFFAHGRYHWNGIMEKETRGTLPAWGWAPVDLDAGTITRAYGCLEKGARALGLTEGPVKADMILMEDGTLVTLEIEPRLHGDVSTCGVMPWVGMGPWRKLLTRQLDHHRGPYGFAAWWVLPHGWERWRGLELPQGVSCTLLWRNPKASQPEPKSTAEIAGYLALAGETRESVLEAREALWG